MIYQELVESIDNENKMVEAAKTFIENVTYSMLYDSISKRVIGQPELKKILAQVYNYLINVANDKPIDHNFLLTAPSGTGKTETYRALREFFKEYLPGFPIYIVDTSQLTETGFKGGEPRGILQPLVDYRCEAPYGIVFLDEFDKKIKPSYSGSHQNVNRSMQENLLTIVEGSKVEVKYSEGMRNRTTIIDTKNLMFVGIGSFDFCREERQMSAASIGFGSKDAKRVDFYSHITREDMINAGGSYELIGRFRAIINYGRLDEEAIVKIIDKMTAKLEDLYSCKIDMDDAMLAKLIDNANSNFGCRLLESIIIEDLLPVYTMSLCDEQKDSKRLHVNLTIEGATYDWDESGDASFDSF